MDAITNDTLMQVFDMINDRLYTIERNTQKTLKYVQDEAIQAQHLPAYLFEYPFDILLDNTNKCSKLTNKNKPYCILKFDKNDCSCLKTTYLSTNVYMRKNKDAIRTCLVEWFDASKANALYDLLFEKEVDDWDKEPRLQSTYWNVKTHHVWMNEYIMQRHLKMKFPEIAGICCYDDDHYFVVKDLQDVNCIVQLSTRIMEAFGAEPSAFKSLTIVADLNIAEAKLWLWTYNGYDSYDEHKFKKLIEHVPTSDIKKYIKYELQPMLPEHRGTTSNLEGTRSKMLRSQYKNETTMLRKAIYALQNKIRGE